MKQICAKRCLQTRLVSHARLDGVEESRSSPACAPSDAATAQAHHAGAW